MRTKRTPGKIEPEELSSCLAMLDRDIPSYLVAKRYKVSEPYMAALRLKRAIPEPGFAQSVFQGVTTHAAMQIITEQILKDY